MSGFFVFAMVYLGFAFAQLAWQYWLLFGIYGLYMAATDGVSKAGAVDLVPADKKGAGLGALGTVTGLGAFFASLVAGFLWDHAGSAFPFYYGALGSMLALFCLLRCRDDAQQTKV